MGFDDDFKLEVSDTQLYKQFGNSVVVPAVKAVAEAMHPFLATALRKGKASGRARSIEIRADALKGRSTARSTVDVAARIEATNRAT
jgi:DNA (cytosine-5)-methyltransferase 1